MSIDSIVVVGSGTMGRGIAQVAATAGLKTFLFDAMPAQLKGAGEQIERDLKRLVDKGKLTAEVAGRAKANLAIAESLDRNRWNKARAARELGLSYPTLLAKIRTLEIERRRG